MKKTDLFFTTYVVYASHITLLLDEAKIAALEGRNVKFVVCDGCLKYCRANVLGSKAYCRFCRFIALNSIRALPKNVKVILLGDFMTDSILKDVRVFMENVQFKTIEELKKVYFKEVDVGYSVASSLISITRNASGVMNKYELQLANNFMECSLLLSLLSGEMLDRISPDRCVVFNWRSHDERPIYRVAKLRNLPVNCYDFRFNVKKGVWDKFSLQNTYIHDVAATNALIRSIWESETEITFNEKKNLAFSYFTKRRKGNTGPERYFGGGQIEGLLPDSWDSSFTNIVIFNSSEDEFASLDEEYDQYRYLGTQLEVFERVLELLKEAENTRVYLRIHPNLAGVKHSHHTDLYALPKQFKNLFVIAPESDVSTYELLDNADKTITCGSTVGIESVFWGTPSILLGPAAYRFLGGVYVPKNDEELTKLLNSELPKPDQLPALMYGYYMMAYEGKSFEHFSVINNAHILGVKLPFYSQFCKFLGSSRLCSLLFGVYAILFFPSFWYKRRKLWKKIC